MRFVEVEHPALGRTVVPESRIAHLNDDWEVVDGDRPEPEPESRFKATSFTTNFDVDDVEDES